MSELPVHILMGICGMLCGILMGGAARVARFCTFGAIEDYVLAGKTQRAKAWALAIAVAITLTQTLHLTGLIQLEEVFYLTPNFGWAGAILGGLLFGFGMALTGTCGYGVITRMAGGDLRAALSFLVLGLAAFATARGVLAPVRVNIFERFNVQLEGAGGQGIPQLLNWILGSNGNLAWIVVSLIAVCGLLLWIFSDNDFRASKRDVFSGLAIGCAVAAGFAATGILGRDDFEPQRMVSLTYVLPPGETIVYFLTFTGASITFGIGVVLGTLLGAFGAAVMRREFRWEGYDDAREMRRHIIGATLMGFGGVSALGCTIGQGVTGMATLSLSAPLALTGIIIGGVFGVNYLLTGSLREAFSALLARG